MALRNIYQQSILKTAQHYVLNMPEGFEDTKVY